MPSTFFTEPPHWRWLIILYFFFENIARLLPANI